MKLAHSLEKMIAKLEDTKYNFQDDTAQADFDSMKSDVIAAIEEMVQLLHDDEEAESNNKE
jgi:hypothetical protein